MNHHLEAWEHIKKHLFGTVCEVVRKKPWGFKEDREDIQTKTVDEFLNCDERFGTVILHILSGEGEPKENILKVLEKAENNAVKVVILEHNPEIWGLPEIDFGKGIYENWGRNVLFAFSSLGLLEINELSDKYVSEHIDQVYVNETDHGICAENLIYTHTSESPIDFDLPKGTINWVIGGGLPYESMRDGDVLFDSVLRQCLFSALKYGTPKWKIDMIYKFKPLKELKENWLPHWRKPDDNGNRPSKIVHKRISDFKRGNIYVSTVDYEYWKHLKGNILEAFTEPRDKIKWKLM